MAPNLQHRDLLRLRLVDLLIDDEEYLEDLYLGVNFDVADQLLTRRRAYFRMTAILEELDRMEGEGLVTSHKQDGWHYSAGIHCTFFALTEAGRGVWKSDVKPLPAEQLYEPDEGNGTDEDRSDT